MQELGMLAEQRIQMSAVLSVSTLGGNSVGVQAINVVDLITIQKQLEIEVIKRAMTL